MDEAILPESLELEIGLWEFDNPNLDVPDLGKFILTRASTPVNPRSPGRKRLFFDSNNPSQLYIFQVSHWILWTCTQWKMQACSFLILRWFPQHQPYWTCKGTIFISFPSLHLENPESLQSPLASCDDARGCYLSSMVTIDLDEPIENGQPQVNLREVTIFELEVDMDLEQTSTGCCCT